MKNNRIFRVLVCVALIMCLLVSWSPVRVRASALPEVAGVVTKVIPLTPSSGAAAGGAALGSQVFGWVLLGIGVVVGAAKAVELLNGYVEYSGELETSIYYFADGTWSYGVDMSFVQSVREYLFGTGILVKNDTVELNPAVEVPVAAIAEAKAGRYSVLVYHSKGTYISYDLAYSNQSPVYARPYKDDGTGVEIGCDDSDATIYLYSAGESKFNAFNSSPCAQSSNKTIISTQYFGTSLPHIEISIEESSIEYVAPIELPMPEAYPEWHTNARPATDPDTDEEIAVLPIPLNPSTDTDGLPDGVTQPDVWPGSVADPLPGLDTNPDTGTDVDPDSGSTGNTPSTDIDDYRLDLTSFFPFCIPFDVARFVNVLQADPVAPLFEFELQLPFREEPYLIIIDLAPFDSLAALARRLELLGFCIALAVATRNFYIRG